MKKIKKKIKILIIIIFLVLIGIVLWALQHRPVPPTRIESNQIQEDTSEDLEKCTCGNCDLDIFSCTCPTAKKQREARSSCQKPDKMYQNPPKTLKHLE